MLMARLLTLLRRLQPVSTATTFMLACLWASASVSDPGGAGGATSVVQLAFVHCMQWPALLLIWPLTLSDEHAAYPLLRFLAAAMFSVHAELGAQPESCFERELLSVQAQSFHPLGYQGGREGGCSLYFVQS